MAAPATDRARTQVNGPVRTPARHHHSWKACGLDAAILTSIRSASASRVLFRRTAGARHDLGEQEADIELRPAVRYFDAHFGPAPAAHQIGAGQAVEAAATDPAGGVTVRPEQHAIERVDDGPQSAPPLQGTPELGQPGSSRLLLAFPVCTEWRFLTLGLRYKQSRGPRSCG